MKFKVGDVVTWTSQAAGVAKEKTGPIVAIVPKSASIRAALSKTKKATLGDVVHACDSSYLDRYVVETKQTKTKRHLHAPTVLVVDRQNDSAKQHVERFAFDDKLQSSGPPEVLTDEDIAERQAAVEQATKDAAADNQPQP